MTVCLESNERDQPRLALLVADRVGMLPVAIHDTVPSYRQGLAAAFTDAGYRTEDPADLEEWVRAPGPRALLVTLAMPDDCQIIRCFAETNEELIIVALLHLPVPEMYARVLEAGATGVARWGSSAATIIAVVESARHGHVLLPRHITRAMGAAAVTRSAELKSISPMEADWLQLLAKGHTVAELARAVGYSERAMFRLLRQLYDRMSVKNRTEALLKAAQCGVV